MSVPLEISIAKKGHRPSTAIRPQTTRERGNGGGGQVTYAALVATSGPISNPGITGKKGPLRVLIVWGPYAAIIS